MELSKTDPDVLAAINLEIDRQNDQIELIASENFVSKAVLEAQGCVMTNKYAEGYPAKRYYGGCVHVDTVEDLARDRIKKLFGCDHVNVQPHSGSQANMAVYLSALKEGDTIMGLSLTCGGHLTHGHPVNFSGRLFNVVQYGVNKETERIDFDEVRKLALEHRPKMIITGASAYPRIIDFKRFREICDEIGAKLMVDMAHIAGLIAANLHPSPVPHSEFVTTTTHKTLRGPRGGMILCKEEFAKSVDKHIFPGIQGGPLMHVIAAKAVAFQEALQPDFKVYQQQIVKNAKVLADTLTDKGFRLVSGGTDNHLMLVDLTNKNITGKEAEKVLEEVHITVNKNTIPYDQKSPFVTSGIRIGTPAMTTRGFKEDEMRQVGEFISRVISDPGNVELKQKLKQEVVDLCKKFPIYSDMKV